MMRDKRYWNNFHPEHAALVDLVRQGFEELYPGPLEFDATGRVINDPAPEQAGGPDPTVHVRSYTQTRGDGSVQVSEHDRSAPGGGAVAQSSEGKGPKPPAMKPPVPNAKIRERDGYGEGYFGARRTKGPHTGVDIVTKPGEIVTSPVSGRVEKRPANNGVYNNGQWIEPYPDEPEKAGHTKGVGIYTPDGARVRVLYVDPDAVGLKPGQRVEAGDPIGTAQDLSRIYPPTKDGVMTNHSHVDIKKDGKYIDPTEAITRKKD
jgi:murein DD-endopeptidase MepM/ murein hydrolase activator NlpD